MSALSTRQLRSLSQIRRMEKQHGPMIPRRVILDVLERFNPFDTLHALARKAGVSERRIWGLETGEIDRLSLWVVDRLISEGLELPDLWWSEPELREYYQRVG